MAQPQSSNNKTTPLAAQVQDNTMLGSTPKKFIGAVEDEWQLYSDRAEDYTIGSPIGFGASSIVYAAKYYPAADRSGKAQGVPCALKVLDLDSLPPRSLQLLQRETTLMSLSKHPNVLRVRGSWMDGHKLYIALRLMNKGSAADVMRYGWPGGMEEDVVKCILRQALKGLNYLHINGFIHRDVKAANLLIDDDGTVLLGDLGVAADLSEDSSHLHSSSTTSNVTGYSITAKAALSQSQSAPMLSSSSKRGVAFDSGTGPPVGPVIRKRKSFVGTPCWMSPELIQGKQYDSSADIWSFGITALELTQGRPPRSRESPQRVLLRTIQEDPPSLDREGGAFKYSRAFKEMVDSCLIKDPSKRPTAEQLLQSPFFKSAKSKSYLINTILKDLPPLAQRQERRVMPPLLSANSMDSWDFATTVNSPTTSVYRRGVLEEFVREEDQRLHAEGVFDMDGSHPNSSNTLAAQHHHHLHHHLHSHLSQVADLTSDEEDESEDDGVDGDAAQSKARTRLDDLRTSSSPSSASHSSFLSSDAALSQSSSPPTNSSAASSYSSPSDLARRLSAAAADAAATPQSKDKGSRPMSPTNEKTLVGLNSVLPSHSRSKSSPAPPSKNKDKKADADTTPQASKLWSRLKSNVNSKVRSSSTAANGSGNSSNEETPTKKDTLKASMSGMLSSASKGLLSRAPSRTVTTTAATPSKDKK